jgi:hypothetical protein
MKLIIPILLIAMVGCQTSGKLNRNQHDSLAATPRLLVYKTKADYRDRVPVMLNEDRTQITGYPDPRDVVIDGSYPLPTRLKSGYLLDNRGISVNVAFLKTTYKEYASLQRPPVLEELFSVILDPDPLVELIDCGSRTAFTDPVAEINRLIQNKTLRTTFKVLK